MDTIGSIFGILLSSIYELIFKKNFLHSRLKSKKHKITWFLLVIFRRNFKKYVLDLGLDPWKYPTTNDLRKIRTTSKEDIDKYFSKDSTSKILQFFSLKMSSSGSTGKPFEFSIFLLQWIEEQARVYASLKLGGYQIGRRMVVFRSYSPKSWEKNIKEVRWKRWTYFNSFSLDEKSLQEYYDYLIKHRIEYLRIYPSTLATFLNFLKSRKLKIKLKMLHVSSENISNELIDEAQEFFECKLINYYGQVEQAILGVNILNARSISILPYTDWYMLDDGTVAALNLLNWTNPLINYRVQDQLLMIKENHFNVTGRNNIFLNHSKGFKVSTINFFTLMQKFKNLVKWQIFQDRNLNIQLNYEGYLSPLDKKQITDGFKERLGDIPIRLKHNKFKFNGEGKINPIVVENNGN